MNSQLWLAVAVASAGLWSGLLLTVTTILHPMFRTQDDPGFVADLHRFLPIARRSPTNYVLVLAMVIAPVGALWTLRDGDGSGLVLTALGLAFVLVGAVGISRWMAEPNYDVILGWQPSDPVDHLHRAQRRYYHLNWLRAGMVWVAFTCLLAALVVD